MAGGDGEPVAVLIQRHGRLRLEAFRRETRLRELQGQSHRETTRMRSADQLFRIRSGTAFETGCKTIRRVFQYAGLRRNVTFTVLDATTPFCRCCFLHECSPESQGGYAAQYRRSMESTVRPVAQAPALDAPSGRAKHTGCPK